MGLSLKDIPGVKLISKALSWLLPEVEQDFQGTELTKPSTDAWIPKIYGTVKKHTGTIIFKATNDADTDDIKNDLLHQVIVWAEASQSIDVVYIEDIDIESNNPLFVVDGERYSYARNFTNNLSNYSDPLLTDAGWRSTDHCSYKSSSYIRNEAGSGENQLNNEPKLTVDITGTTTSNPADHLLDYLTNAQYGKGESTSRLNLPAFTTAQAVCNTQVESVLNSGVFRSLFTCNIALDTGNTVLDNVNLLLKSMRAMMPILDGKLTPIIEKDDPAVSLEILETDIIELGEITNSSKRDRYNRVIVTYRDKDANATNQEAIYPPKDSQIETDWLAEDNGVVLEKSFKLETCDNYYEALAYAKALAQISREQLSTTVLLPIWATLFEAGDIVNITHSIAGFDQKPFRIISTEESDTDIALSVREHQPYIYDFENTGLKPSFPDTSNIITKPATPANLTKIEVYTSLRQVDITWTGTTSRYQVLIEDSNGLEVENYSSLARKKVEIRNYPLGDYTIYVRAINSLGTPSDVATFAFTLDQAIAAFVWTAYADNASGLNISLTDADQDYIGFAYGQDSATASIANSDVYGFILRPEAGNSAPGVDGVSFYSTLLFIRSATEPTKPADNSASFNFGTSVLTPPAGWSEDIPTGTAKIWSTRTRFEVSGNTGVDSTCTFSDVSAFVENGTDGTTGQSIYVASCYVRSATVISNTPSGGSYNFTNKTLTPPNSTFAAIPVGTDPVYISSATAAIDGVTGSDSTLSWSPFTLLVENGADGSDGSDGNDGNDGADGQDGEEAIAAIPISILPALTGGAGDFRYSLNFGGGTANDGELTISATRFAHPDGTERTLTGDISLYTAFGDGGGVTGKFYIVYSDELIFTRFAAGDRVTQVNSNFFMVSRSGNDWVLRDNNVGLGPVVTLRATDVFIAVVTADVAGEGLTSIVPFTGGIEGLKGEDGDDGVDAPTANIIRDTSPTTPTAGTTNVFFIPTVAAGNYDLSFDVTGSVFAEVGTGEPVPVATRVKVEVFRGSTQISADLFDPSASGFEDEQFYAFNGKILNQSGNATFTLKTTITVNGPYDTLVAGAQGFLELEEL